MTNLNIDGGSYHPEEYDNAANEGRPILLSRLIRYDHLQHDIPLGSLVEVEITISNLSPSGSDVNLKGRCTLIVVGHKRDCDGTPLYQLSDIPVIPAEMASNLQELMRQRFFSKLGNILCSKDSLKAIGKTVELFESVSRWLNH